MANRRSKLPWCQFYPADWLADPELSLCGPATRGIWADWLAAMWERGQTGEIMGSIEQLARVGRCSEHEAQAAIDELERSGAADVDRVTGNGSGMTQYSVRNRRMHRAASARKSNADRQKRHRQRQRDGDSNAVVTQESRDRDQRPDIKQPPPRVQTELETPSGPWSEVVVVLRQCGVGNAEAAADMARQRGASPAEVLAVCRHYQSQPGAWSAGLLFTMISGMTGGVPVSWPKPAAVVPTAEAKHRAWQEGVERQERDRQERAKERESLRSEYSANPFDMTAEFKRQLAANGAAR